MLVSAFKEGPKEVCVKKYAYTESRRVDSWILNQLCSCDDETARVGEPGTPVDRVGSDLECTAGTSAGKKAIRIPGKYGCTMSYLLGSYVRISRNLEMTYVIPMTATWSHEDNKKYLWILTSFWADDTTYRPFGTSRYQDNIREM